MELNYVVAKYRRIAIREYTPLDDLGAAELLAEGAKALLGPAPAFTSGGLAQNRVALEQVVLDHQIVTTSAV
jgi:hypothetical protein